VVGGTFQWFVLQLHALDQLVVRSDMGRCQGGGFCGMIEVILNAQVLSAE